MRIPSEEFAQKPLFVHEFLSDVPLHDVWTVPLRGGGEGRGIKDVQRLLLFDEMTRPNPLVSALFKLRWTLGRLFRWDNEQAGTPAASYIHRLARADRARSQIEPGSGDTFKAVYAFDNESLSEIINGTVHAFLHLSMEQAADGYMLYLAIYVKRVNWFTPFYMALIDPFRRWIVYPGMIAKIQRTWAATYA